MIASETTEATIAENKKEASTLSKASGSSRSYNIFFVDDDPMILKMLSRHLSKNQQYNISTFSSGEDCIESLSSNAPDIVVLDFHLSEEINSNKMNGLAILKKIKSLQPEVQVIMLSSQMEVQIAVDCLKKGAVNYVVKDDIMQFNVQKGIESIVKSNALKDEIHQLSNTIKRDKLLIRGYSFILIALVMTLYYFWMK